MTNQEINIAVAKKLGWTNIQDRSELGYGIHWTGKNPNKKEPKNMPEGYVAFDQLPNYCTSIEAAWEIVEYLKPKHWFSLEYDDDLFQFCFSKPKNKTYIEACADTAPMAICLAFFKLP